MSLPPTCVEKNQLKDTRYCANKKLLRRVAETQDPANSSNFLHLAFFFFFGHKVLYITCTKKTTYAQMYQGLPPKKCFESFGRGRSRSSWLLVDGRLYLHKRKLSFLGGRFLHPSLGRLGMKTTWPIHHF